MSLYFNDLKAIFPFSNINGADASNIKTQKMQKVAASKPALTGEEIKSMIIQHHQFLSTGGAGGNWQTLLLQGMVIGIYIGADATSGVQAIFEKSNISLETELQEIGLPFANFCGVFCKSQDFSEANLSHCLFTDAY
jgi:uncharacterized protein YjbI with pentapeptide repeats